MIAQASTNECSSTHLVEYKILAVLGEGRFGRVFKLQNKVSQEICAAKKVINNDLSKSECEIMERIGVHSNVVTFHKKMVFQTATYILMENIEGTSLADHIASRNLSNSSAISIFQGIATALEYIHSIGIAHRDVKPDNIIVDSITGNAKLIDFGLSALSFYRIKMMEYHGSPFYMAPELASLKEIPLEQREPYTNKIDIWSLAITMMLAIASLMRFDGIREVQMFKRTRKPNLKNTLLLESCNTNLKKLLHKCLKVNARKRLTATELLRFMNRNECLIVWDEEARNRLLNRREGQNCLSGLINCLRQF